MNIKESFNNEENDLNLNAIVINNNDWKDNNLSKNEIKYNLKKNDDDQKNKENNKQEKDDNNLSTKIININKKNSFIQEKVELRELKGFFEFYLISVILSIAIKIIIDNAFIGEYKYSSRKKDNIYFIIFYYIFSLISYLVYWSCILKQEKKFKKNIIKSSMKLYGYIIYKETSKTADVCFDSCYDCGNSCEDCKIYCNTLNLSLCCYSFSCKCCCKGIFCCDCNEKNNLYKVREFKDINKIETIHTFYRTTGRWNWIVK